MPAPNPMGPCTGPLGCKLDHGGFPANATWCVTLAEVPPFPACDYHADLLKRALDGLVAVSVEPIELLDELLDLDSAEALDADPGDRVYTEDGLPEGSCVCHDSTMCPEAQYAAWAPGELSEAFGR